MNNISSLFALKTFSHWPDIKKMRNQPNDQYDYICVASGIEIKTKKGYAFWGCTSYLMLDYYEQEANINFETLSTEDTDTYCKNSLVLLKKPTKASINMIFQGEEVRLKLDPVLSDYYQFQSLEEAIEHQISHEFKMKLQSIQEYLKKNHIGCDQDEFNDFYEKSMKAINNRLSIKELEIEFEKELALIRPTLLNNYLEKDLISQSNSQRNIKRKI